MAENEQRIKSVSTDPRSKNRLRFSSTKQRAKNASADVYRSYKRRLGSVTSAASREERVHHPSQDESSKHRNKRPRKSYDGTTDRVAVLGGRNEDAEEESSNEEMDIESTFASELDLAHDRNASEIFSHFYRDIWHLVQSLPEVLHHASDIVDILLSYLLSPETTPEEKSPTVDFNKMNDERVTYIANQATTDILHLMAVLARDLRHEIHPFVHSQIVPRIVYDLLNPPLPPPESGKQPLPMSVTLVEAAFRMLSYIFRYDSEPILAESEKQGQEPCLEKMRQYYGATLGHKRDYVRRLAAESFAPLIRKLKTDSARQRHIRRVLRALAASGQDESAESISKSLKRAQSDAVDGVSFLLFETARGMSGRLHSRGHQVIRCVLDSLTKGAFKGGAGVLHAVTSAFVEKICHHLKRENFSVVWKEIFKAASSLATAEDPSNNNALPFMLELVDQIIEFKSGIYIRKPDKGRVVPGYDESVKSLVGLLSRLLDPNVFCRLPCATQALVLQVLTASWRALPENPRFAAQLGPLLPALLSLDKNESSADDAIAGNEDDSLNPATILAQDLLPFLPPESGVKLVGQAILAAAARQTSSDPAHALSLLFAVASIRRSSDSDGSNSIDDDDNVFFTENAPCCSISAADKSALLDLCLVDGRKCCCDRGGLAQLGVAVRCLPFLLLAGKDDDGDNSSKECTSFLKMKWKWALGVCKTLDKLEENAPAGATGSLSVDDVVVAKSLLLEACAKIASICIDEGVDKASSKKCVVQMRPFAEKLLLMHPRSIWAVKGVASFVGALKRCDLHLNDSPNEVFQSLVPNLRQKNHFLRLHSLEILASYPKRPFVTDHAEIDWTDDLDEEPSHAPNDSSSKSAESSNMPSGLCDVIETLLKLESTPIRFQNERELVACITRIEVLGRSSRIPVLYAEAASNHMLGIFYVKFSPLWPAATRALVALAISHEASVWDPLAARIKEVTSIVDANDATESHLEGGPIMSHIEHHLRCVAWEATSGNDPGLFRGDVYSAQEDGRVSRHLWTDEPTVFGLVWGVLEGAPELTAKKSRLVVPVFLEFLHRQYFHYHDNDPDARELRLEDEMEETMA
jgi:hypothetical protein